MPGSRLLKRLADWKSRLLSGREARLENELIRLTRPDAARRLIELEQEKNPRASRESCIESALRRLKRDRG
jgi:hypothetical protein